ncbi:Abscisic-aldehyde oxidase [Nymphon striatum]|nr:Abscisic-aldehyde oxidase [Nymphon striatum]
MAAVCDAPLKTDFHINGKKYSAVGPENTMMFSEYLREKAYLTGTKVACKSGACGACIVPVTLKDPVHHKTVTITVPSCLLWIYQLDKVSIETIESISKSKTGELVVHKLNMFNASQCGFCSPGMVTNMYNAINERPHPSQKFLEKCMDGSICRCTGYVSILQGIKLFVDPKIPDIEDLCTYVSCEIPSDDFETVIPKYSLGGLSLYKPIGTKELYNILAEQSGKKYRFVFGNTADALYQLNEGIDCIIYLRGVIQFYQYVVVIKSPIEFGSNISLNEVIQMLRNLFQQDKAMKYVDEIADFIETVGNRHIRNISGWAGNLGLKHKHNDFQSDIYLIFEAVAAKITVRHFCGSTEILSPLSFLKIDMNGKAIEKITIPKYSNCGNIVFKAYKVLPRACNAPSYVSAAFFFEVDYIHQCLVQKRPTIVFQGISDTFTHASKTEEFLEGKYLGDRNVVLKAMQLLAEELVPSPNPGFASVVYRKSLAKDLFYRFVLYVNFDELKPVLRSGGEPLIRPLFQCDEYYKTEPIKWPLTKAVTKIEGLRQLSGEIKYIGDFLPKVNQLYGAFVVSTIAYCKLADIDPKPALGMEGVVNFLSAKDIPQGGTNTFNGYDPRKAQQEQTVSVMELFVAQMITNKCQAPMENSNAELARWQHKHKGPNLRNHHLHQPTILESYRCYKLYLTFWQLFCSTDIIYAGQPIGMVFATTEVIALKAAPKVLIVYKDRKKPILTIDDALDRKIILEGSPESLETWEKDFDSGDALKGDFYIGGQDHFFLEPHSCVCSYSDSYLDVWSSTESLTGVQKAIGIALGIEQNKITVKTEFVGGAFGGKQTSSQQPAVACALASYLMGVPVKVIVPMDTTIRMSGKRVPFRIKYSAYAEENGLLNTVIMTYFLNCGAVSNTESGDQAFNDTENVYECRGKWLYQKTKLLTNLPANHYFRAPGSFEAIVAIETIIEHIAYTKLIDPIEVRKLNWDTKDPDDTFVANILETALKESEFYSRKSDVQNFNSQNFWKKKGIALIPLKFPVNFIDVKFNVQVSINAYDSSIIVSHGGVEMGQGLNTKVSQTCGYILKAPLDKFRFLPSSTDTAQNNRSSNYSIPTDLCCYGAVQCCKELKKRLDAVDPHEPVWEKLIEKCAKKSVDLCVRNTYSQDDVPKNYRARAVSISEIELDILTGEIILSRVDIFYDCGESISPLIDIGQIEGGFVQGLGLILTEKLRYNPDTGENLTYSPWTYHAPVSTDIPADFRVKMLNRANKGGVLATKTTEEAPVCLAISVVFAIRNAIQKCRADTFMQEWFMFDLPSTPEEIYKYCGDMTDQERYLLEKEAKVL